ncbi:hypothetical protein C5167_030921 [Papaver somniferum]|uniref:uncharacterized protein LOC113334945 n=1 Tax=Papaver somniferum TaxID=3469 RepID=UPI000E6FA7DB|nr:uncharacterized protein LOC113334945 [Papaver somniferum]RZC89235.1 hypothetical protein C5167_030921 [Papaver somniferum]
MIIIMSKCLAILYSRSLQTSVLLLFSQFWILWLILSKKLSIYKPKLDVAVKQVVDRNEDMIRSALRAISSLSRISGGDCGLKYKSLMSDIMKSIGLSGKYMNSDCFVSKTFLRAVLDENGKQQSTTHEIYVNVLPTCDINL